MFISVLTIGFYLSTLITKNWAVLHSHLRLIIIFDAILLGYFSFGVIQVSLTLIYAILSLYIGFGFYLIELNVKLLKFIQSWNTPMDMNYGSYIPSIKRLIDSSIFHFQSKYVHIFTIILRLNGKLVSKIMLVTLLCNFSFNIYTITLWSVRKNLLPEETAFLISIFLCQIYLISMACLILIQFSEKFYLSKQSIFRLASFPTIPFYGYLLKSLHHIRSKIHLAIFYEEINTIKPFRFNAGWVGIISKQTMSRFLMFYIAHLLLSLKFANK